MGTGCGRGCTRLPRTREGVRILGSAGGHVLPLTSPPPPQRAALETGVLGPQGELGESGGCRVHELIQVTRPLGSRVLAEAETSHTGQTQWGRGSVCMLARPLRQPCEASRGCPDWRQCASQEVGVRPEEGAAARHAGRHSLSETGMSTIGLKGGRHRKGFGVGHVFPQIPCFVRENEQPCSALFLEGTIVRFF